MALDAGANYEMQATQLMGALNQLTDAIVIYDAQDRFVVCNDAHRRLYPKLAAAFVPGTPLEAILRHGLREGQWKIPAGEHEKFVTERIAQYHLPFHETVRELGDGRWTLVRDRRMPDGMFIGTRTDITELKLREKRYQKAERDAEIFRGMVDHLPIQIYAKTEDLRLTYANQACCEVIGCTMADAIGKSGSDLGGDREEITAADRQVLAAGKMISFEETQVRPDGSQTYLVAHKRPFQTADGTNYLIGTTTDITDLKQREQRLQEAQRENEMFRNLVDNLPISIYAKTADLKHTYVNKAWSDLIGLPRESAIGKTDIELMGADAEAFAKADREVLAGLGTDEFEEIKNRADGSTSYWIGRKRAFHGSDGQLYIIGSTSDVTDLKQREQRLQEAQRENEIFRHLVDNLPIAIYAKTEDRRLIYVNQAWSELTGVAIKDGLGKTDEECQGTDGEVFAAADKEVLAAMSTTDFHEAVDKPDGTKQYRVSNKRAFQSTNGLKYLVGSTTDITELKLRELKLRDLQQQADQSAALLTDATNAMAQGMMVFGPERIELVSDKAAELLEVPAHILATGAKWEDYLAYIQARGDYGSGEEMIRNMDAIRGILQRGERHRFERWSPSGRKLLIQGESRLAGGVVTTISDVTEQAALANELELSKRRFQSFAESNADWFWEMDSELRFSSFSESFESVTGVNPATQLFQSLRETGVPGVDSDQLDDHLETLDNHEPFRDFVHSQQKPDGATIWLSTSGIPIFDAKGGFSGYMGSGRDVTPEFKQRRKRQKAEKRAKALFDDLVDTLNSMSLAVVVVDRDTKCEIINDSFYKLWNIGKDTFQSGSPFRKLMDFNRHNGVYAVKDDDWENYVNARQAEIRLGNVAPRHFERADGVHMIYSVTNLSSERRLITYFDITEQKRREGDLETATSRANAADRAKSEFLANMSHEIRTPMNGVMGMAELLAKTGLDAKQRTFVDIIVKSGASLLTIINDILDFSKIDAGQMELDPAPFRLAEAIEDVATLVSSKVAEKDLELAVRVDPALPEMFVGDVGRIRQIVTNLMGNAVKFTEHGHVLVDVSGEMAEGEVPTMRLKVRVEDTGIGIPKDKLATIFEKFSQVDTSATRKHEGTGLGLAIMRSLVALMGGEVGVDSEVGKGSTFWFTIVLPVHGEAARKRRIPVDVTGARILVVDDNAVNRAILSEQMTAWRFDSAACESGAEALAVLAAARQNGFKINLVLLDYHMPAMNGGDVAKAMRADPLTRDIPIVMLTSVDQTEDGRAFSSLGIDAHLTKPARSSLLLETLIEVLEDHAQHMSKTEPAPVAQAPAPAAIAHAPAPAPIAHATPVARQESGSELALQGASIDILVAEDNEVNQIVFTQILQGTGHTFLIAPNGKKAVELFVEHRPRIVLMDVSMPVMNGLDATREIRRLESGRHKHTPVIGVTAHAIKGDMDKCMAAGMDDYVTKPVSPDSLMAKVEKWMASGEGFIVARSA